MFRTQIPSIGTSLRSDYRRKIKKQLTERVLRNEFTCLETTHRFRSRERPKTIITSQGSVSHVIALSHVQSRSGRVFVDIICFKGRNSWGRIEILSKQMCAKILYLRLTYRCSCIACDLEAGT